MFAGLISKEKPVFSWGDAEKIMAALAPYSLDKPRDYWSTDKQMLLQVATRIGSTSAEIYRHIESGIAVAFWGRLDNRPDLITQLEAQHKASDDELIALAWLKWGEHCPEKLIGDFAFAVASPKTGVVFLARDVMGVKPLYYRADEHGVFFANSAAAFMPLKLGTLTRSQKWMAEYMLGLSYSHTETAYEEIKKLQGAHCLLIHADGRMNIRRYHQFVDDAPYEKKRDPKYLEAYKSAWQEAVACRMPSTGNIGTENSGGLDSGSITAEVASQLGNSIDRLSCFGICLEEQEPALIMATAMKYAIPWVYLTSVNYDDARNGATLSPINIFGYPMEHRTATDHSQFYKICGEKGIGTLFSGLGGDEVVTNYGGCIFFELVDNKDYVNLFRTLHGSVPKRMLRTAKMLINGFRMPSLNASELKAYTERMQYSVLFESVEKQFNLVQTYLNQADWGVEIRRINTEVLLRINQPYIQTRLENCTLFAAAHGVDYVWPLLDARLIQQWLSTPSIWKMGYGMLGRYLHRMAIDGACPDAVAWKAAKDMGFASTYRFYNELSNVNYFEKLSALSELVKGPLDSVLDVNKMREIATQGIERDLRGFEINLIMEMTTSHLSMLLNWVEYDAHANAKF